jgi:hypothetical protein
MYLFIMASMPAAKAAEAVVQYRAHQVLMKLMHIACCCMYHYV